ncbi:hypothetical protein F5Y00DRAFT_151509 [Daldinia vernicosa]|uniref:uncharacterized protein n=1 Tax=Daldinia vernicosa TaxID=114800 RepID=UPI0020087E4B|nr:uncharacterized protein F5Y00DRAFT_151509 [Daldinia vernicosa]KAI0846090.1 hypothetical protein F5Y00DRAFT_151509 [Daldinia vernicosa]
MSEPFGVLKEVKSEQLKSYTPDQFCTIISQRDHVRNLAQAESPTVNPPPGFQLVEGTPPWVPPRHEECRFICCQSCRPSCEARSYLSLDGIANGDIPPTAAIGFGFHTFCFRPIIHPDRLKNIGLRAVPWPLAHDSPTLSAVGPWRSSWNSSWESLNLADGQVNETEQVRHVEDVKDVEHIEDEDAEDVEHVEHVERVKSVRFQPNGTNGTIPSVRPVLRDSFEESVEFTVSVGSSIPLLAPQKEEKARLCRSPT